MSKIDELKQIYLDAWCGAEGDAISAGIAAVVRALRDEMVAIWNMRGDPVELLDEILGDAGEKVAGGSSSNADKATEAGGARCATICASAPATDPAPVYPDEPLVVSATGLGLSPAPAPAVCVWTDVGDKYRSACGRSHFAWTSREGVVVCPECKAPIKFTEAQR